jgi:2,3,4,5-tetrahydropyridine-2-carboxylate N-succinyltransferase
MVDSHALVGSCAQIGAGVHLSAAVQIGGVLEPVNALPVVIEDGVFLGGGCGVYEGTRVSRFAVCAPGVILTGATPLYDLVHERVHRASPDRPLVVPECAVVVPGARPARGAFGRDYGLHLQAPVIVKYRDESTDSSLVLEEALR